jgi:hypothetical protein
LDRAIARASSQWRRGWSAVLRRFQTGSVRTYAMSLFIGTVAIVGYYLWR